MATIFVSRHPGAVEWAKKNLTVEVDQFIEHLDDIGIVKRGDTVIGNLPMAMAADICKKGARYFAIDLPQNREDRGVDLSSKKMEEHKCKIEEFRVLRAGE